jgi:tetratricopeptide (TPR) repeat protein
MPETEAIRLLHDLGPNWGPPAVALIALALLLHYRWNRGERGIALVFSSSVAILILSTALVLSIWYYWLYRYHGLPKSFAEGEVGILIAEASDDETRSRQTAYQSSIVQLIEQLPEMKDVVKVRLLDRKLSPDLEQQQLEAIRIGRWLDAAFVLRPNAVAGSEEPWITIVDQPAFKASDAFMGSFATTQLAQPTKLRMPNDVVRLAQCTLALLFYRSANYSLATKEFEQILSSQDLPAVAPARGDIDVMYGNALLGVEQVAKAEVAFRESIRLNPVSPEAHSNLGWALTLEGNFKESMTEARKAIELQPKFSDAHVTLGVALAHSGHDDQAISEYEIAIENNPQFVQAYNDLGNSLNRVGRREEAVQQIDHALSLAPNFAEGYVNLCVVFTDKHQFKDAIRTCRKAIDLNPTLSVAHLDLGNALLVEARSEGGTYDGAIAEFNAAMKLSPDLPGTHFGMGLALALQGKTDESVKEYEKVLQRQNDTDTHRNLGADFDNLGRREEAIAEYKAALAIRPDNIDAHQLLGQDLLSNRDYAGAILQFREVLRLNPNSFEGTLGICDALVLSGQSADAVPVCRRAKQLRTGSFEATVKLCEALNLDGHLDAALPVCQDAVTLRPNSFEGYLKVCATLVEMRRQDEEALPACEQTIALNPRSSEAHNDLGALYMNKARFSDAISEFRKAISLAPQDAMGHYNLGLALLGTRDGMGEARKEFALTHRLNPKLPVPPLPPPHVRRSGI